MSISSQMKQMTDTVVQISENVVKIANANALKPPVIDIYKDLIEPNILTPRQMAKKYIVATSGMIPAVASLPSTPMVDERKAHFIVYGKFKYKEDGSLQDNEIEDPRCVFDPDNPEDKMLSILSGTTMPLSGNTSIFNLLKNMKNEVKKSFTQIGLKTKAIQTSAENFIGSITIAATTVPGYSLPTAMNPGAIKKSFKDVAEKGDDLSAKINDLIQFFDPILEFLPFLLPDTQIVDTVLSIVNSILMTINIILTIVANLMPAIITVATNIPYPDMPSPFAASNLAMVAAFEAAKTAISYAKTYVSTQATAAMAQVTSQISTVTSSLTSASAAAISAGQAAAAEAKKASERYIVVIDTAVDQMEVTWKLDSYKSTQYKFDSIPEVVLNTAFTPPLNEPTFLIIVGKNLNQTDSDDLVKKILNDNPTMSINKVRSINAGNI